MHLRLIYLKATWVRTPLSDVGIAYKGSSKSESDVFGPRKYVNNGRESDTCGIASG